MKVDRTGLIGIIAVVALLLGVLTYVVPGKQGLPGLQGVSGETGPQGIIGMTGPPGAQGVSGVQGPQGLPGPQGPQGVEGPQGPRGESDVTSPYGHMILDLRVSRSSDDAWRRSDTLVFSLTTNDQNVGSNGPDANRLGGGFRFTDVTIPEGSEIVTAYLTVTALNTLSGTGAKSRISAEDTDDPGKFTDDADDFDARWEDRTTAHVNWDDIPAWTANVEYNSPEIKKVIQEIVDRSGWDSGDDLVIFWEDFEGRTEAVGNKYRTTHAYDSNPSYAMKLHIEYAY